MKGSTILAKMQTVVGKIVIVSFWFGVWQAVYQIVGREIYVPAPTAVFIRLQELVQTPLFWTAISHSVYRVGFGIMLSIVLGVVLGIAAGLSRPFFSLLNPLVVAIKSTPVMSFIILALIWFSSSYAPVFICFLMCFPLIWTNVVEGIANVDKKLLEMARCFRVPPLVVLRRMYLASIFPYFVAAVVTSVGLGWKVTIAAEVLSLPRNSIGQQLYSARVYLDSVELFAWTVAVILLSLLFEIAFVRLVRSRTKV